jgi:hypothetical protein
VTVRNNIIYDPAGNNPTNGSPTMSNNICGSSESCGTSGKQSWSASTVLSTDESNANFMRIGSTSNAVDKGYATGISKYYFGTGSRSGTIDIGADEYGVSDDDGRPSAPRNLRAP